VIRAGLIAIAVLVGAHGAELDAPRLTGALRLREGYRGLDGRLGERGPWQLRESVWRQHMPGMSFAMARQEAPARACALKHIAWLARQLEARGVPATAFNIAAAWNAGLEDYTTGRAPVRAYRYAADVARLYLAVGNKLPDGGQALLVGGLDPFIEISLIPILEVGENHFIYGKLQTLQESIDDFIGVFGHAATVAGLDWKSITPPIGLRGQKTFRKPASISRRREA